MRARSPTDFAIRANRVLSEPFRNVVLCVTGFPSVMDGHRRLVRLGLNIAGHDPKPCFPPWMKNIRRGSRAAHRTHHSVFEISVRTSLVPQRDVQSGNDGFPETVTGQGDVKQ